MGMPYKKSVLPMCGETTVLYSSFMGRPMCAPLNTNVWQDRVFIWALSCVDQCKPQAMPMCGKTVALHGQFHGPINAKPMLCQSVAKQWLYMGSFMGWPMYAPCNANVWQNNGFTGAVSWANPCEPYIMPTPVSGQITIEVNIWGHNFVTNTYLLFESYVEAYL